ncbi:MAG TPA: cation:proton antiporter [Candidatus Saccharimonadales bacterium]|nr:cation:proton antiporter [Candidatus Saccharimonadales bacterium]
MEESIFYQLSLVLAVAGVVSILFRAFRQPLIIGYILTGFLAGPSLLNLIHDHEAFASFSQIGIALLLFIIGLGLNAAVIRTTGKPVFVAFLAVAAGVGLTSYVAAQVLGFSVAEATVLAVALLFSSTIIVIKALSDKKEQNRLYSQIAIGILLVEDILATVALLFISAQNGAGTTSADFGLLAAKGAVLAVALGIFGGYVLPRTVNLVAASQELLFIFALAWAFGVASVFSWYGFSLEVGALFAGVALAHVPYAQEISTRLKPLRDFFIVLFFVELGQNIQIDSIGSAVLPAVALSIIVMLIKPLCILASLGVLGYTRQTGFKAAVHLSQISEFSIIFVVLAVNIGLVSERLATVITLTAVITIILSAYLMKYDDRLYKQWAKRLTVFERSDTNKEVRMLHSYPLVLLGYNKGGHEFVRTFRAMKKRYVVIDYDPDVIEHLEQQHIHHLYGDVTDLELLEELSLHKSELVVSTLTDTDANMLVLQHLARHSKETIFVCHANTYDEAVKLYEKGAGYVLLPHLIGSEQVNSFIRRNGSDRRAFEAYRTEHIDALSAA